MKLGNRCLRMIRSLLSPHGLQVLWLVTLLRAVLCFTIQAEESSMLTWSVQVSVTGLEKEMGQHFGRATADPIESFNLLFPI